jgi:hypothetical protein
MQLKEELQEFKQMNKHLMATIYKKDQEIERQKDKNLNSVAELDASYRNLENNNQLM